MEAIFEASPQGDYISLRSRGRLAHVTKHERGEVKAFSHRSRSRLMKKISQLRKHHLPLFVTLTYPNEFPTDYKEYKYHVHKFLVYLFRAFPGSGVIWKLEFQSRGAAHFHLLVYGVAHDLLAAWVPIAWYKIAGGSDERHLLFHQGKLKNQHCVTLVRSWRGVKSYASKYMAKMDDTTDKTGRFWGVRGDVPFSRLLAMRIDIRTALEFRRAFRRSSGMEFKQFGFWGYGFHVDWLKLIDMLEDQHDINLHPPDPPLRYKFSGSPPLDEHDFF